MNGKLARIETMDCKTCDATVRYNIHDSVSFTDAWRKMQEICVCQNEVNPEDICECNNLDHQTLNVDCPVNNMGE